MKGHVCQRGRRNRQTQVMVYRMGISMEAVCLHGRIGMFLSEDGYILSEAVYPESRPQRATFVMPPRSWGAIGRPQAAPGCPPMAVGGMDGPEGARTESPAKERG